MTTSIKKPHQMITARELARSAFTELRSGWKRYVAIVAIVIVPVDLLALTSSVTGEDPTLSTYSLIVSLIMNVALIWAIVQKDHTGVIPRVGAAYYEGSIAIVRFFLVSAALVLMLAPAALGGAIYVAANTAGINSAAPVGEQLLIGIVCLLLALPSFHLLIRFGLALVAVVDGGMRPLAALRYARRLTFGKYWRLAGRYINLFLLIILIAIPISIGTFILAFLKLVPVATLFFQLATTFTALPIMNMYLLHLYHDIEPKSKEPEPTASEEAA